MSGVTNKIVDISNGHSILELKLNELGSYLKYKKPLVVDWFDCFGSLGKFYAIFSYCHEYRESINNNLREDLNTGNFELESGLNEIIKLLTLFENGKYNLSFEPHYKYEITKYWNWDLIKNHRLYASNAIIRDESQLISDEEKNLHFLTESYYSASSDCLIFTQPSEVINKQRIIFYEEEIKQGKNPIAIIYSGYSQTNGIYEDGSNWIRTIQSANYIIDGHHKLLAYKNLNKTPSLLRIEKIYQSDNDLNFLLEAFENDLSGKLLKCQIRHFRKNYIQR